MTFGVRFHANLDVMFGVRLHANLKQIYAQNRDAFVRANLEQYYAHTCSDVWCLTVGHKDSVHRPQRLGKDSRSTLITVTSDVGVTEIT